MSVRDLLSYPTRHTLAITDHGVMYGLVDFFKAAEEYGIKAILGCEVYVAAKSMHIK
ncbi:PHP domain-containing protein, partial [Clostridium butyricum]|nr:PHP domain-containing protein [Clostridium butyricum]